MIGRLRSYLPAVALSNESGFTLIELLLTVIVLAILASLVIGGVLFSSKPDYNGVPYVEKDDVRYYNLVRFPDEGKVAGVCAGLGYYFGVDPWLFRLGFLVRTFVAGGGLYVYIACWYFMDSAYTPDDFLERTGRN